jgi:hypothetical protein
LGDSRIENPRKAGFSSKSSSRTATISLRPNISFRGAQVINTRQADRFINLNTVVTYQKGSTSFVMPMKKKIVLNGRVTFNPNAATR